MGREYAGDINGKFWFGIQDSDAPSKFGGTIIEPTTINYYFTKEDDLESVTEKVEELKESLGNNKDLIDKFFENHNTYNDSELEELLGCDYGNIISDYADIDIGNKILECLNSTGYCEFEAEV